MVRLNDHRFAPVAEYAYDALGRRIEFRNHYDGSGIYGSGPTEVATRYVYDGQNVIEEYNTNGDRQRYYVHGTGYIDERAVMHDDVGTDEDYYYLLKDLYTVVGLAQANGHELERYIYDAYGKATVVSVLAADVNFDGSVDSLDQGAIRNPARWLQSGCDAGTVYDINADGGIDSLDLGVIRNPANWYHSNTELSASALGNPYFFTGRRRGAYLDAPVGTNGVKQIQYSRARYYDLDNGRWLQRDPIGYKDGMNLYEYVKSSPAVRADFRGLGSYKIGTDPPPDPYETAYGISDSTWGFKAWRLKWAAENSEEYLGEAWPVLRDWFWAQQMVTVGRRKGYPDAATALAHFLGNSGSKLTMSYRKFLHDDRPALRHFQKERRDARRYIERHYEAIRKSREQAIVSVETVKADTPANVNWRRVWGRYRTWSRATGISCNAGRYTMTFEITIVDNYDWDPLAAGGYWLPVGPAGMARLHDYGLAREYPITAIHTETKSWGSQAVWRLDRLRR